MIHEKYENQLLKKVKQLDKVLDNENTLEKIMMEIIEDKDSQSTLELLKKIGIIKNKYNTTKINECCDSVRENLFTYLGSRDIELQIELLKDNSSVSILELSQQLDELIGLNNVKQQVKDLIGFNKIQKLREKSGLKKSNNTLHMAFLGNPGTAKTTVARIVGKMYREMGLLSKGHFIEASRTDLIAEFQGQTAIKVKRLINRAKGGVLFIDEAYSITENSNVDSYGKESLTELTKALEDYREDLVVIVAGYTDLMNNFFESNPGLKSRFNTFIHFDNYSIEELVDIFSYMCSKNDYTINNAGLDYVRKYFINKVNSETEIFANGRTVRNLFDDIVMNQSKRLCTLEIQLDKDKLIEILPEDIPS